MVAYACATTIRGVSAVFYGMRRETLHPLLVNLGPEPLSAEFDGPFLYRLSRGRKGPVKSFIMDAKVVVGVGNIYANEALFLSGIHPGRAAGRISLERYGAWRRYIKQVLTSAIEQGGTTLRDFVGGDGKPGYFAQQLYVYGRVGAALQGLRHLAAGAATGAAQQCLLRDLPTMNRLH